MRPRLEVYTYKLSVRFVARSAFPVALVGMSDHALGAGPAQRLQVALSRIQLETSD